MTTTLISYIAIVLYLLSSAGLLYQLVKIPNEQDRSKLPLVLTSVVAIVLHAWVLSQTVLTENGLNLGFYQALSLMAWVVAVMVSLTSISRPVENLSLVFMPAAALCLLLSLLLPSQRILTDSFTIGLNLHILLSVTAYSLLTMAAVQSAILAIQESQLRNKHPVRAMRILPPMQTMEELLVQLLAIGFFLLSLSLATGLMFVHDMFGQHLSHKVVLSILAWFIFGLVLMGRWAWGWRGRTLIRWTLGGFALLMLAYFGSKLVLEVILHRV